MATNFSNLNKKKEEGEKIARFSAELAEEYSKRMTEDSSKDQKKIFTYGEETGNTGIGTLGSERHNFKGQTDFRIDSTGSEDFFRLMQEKGDLKKSVSQEKKFKIEASIDEDVTKLKEERKDRRKVMLRLFKTKNFNLFKPTTINNMHLLKDAFKKSKIPYPY